MSVIVRITSNFKKEVKPLLKRYTSLSSDLLLLEKELIENPRMGTPLGKNTYKVRLKISSKRKGKSGGARIISLVDTVLIGQVQIIDERITVNLLSIYDKADADTVTDKELKELIKNFKKE